MTQDEIIRMAREAGLPPSGGIVKFAALVAAHVTEALTKSHEAAFQSYVDQAKADRELEVLAARLDEREACANVCEELQTVNPAWVDMNYAEQCAAAIRARGNNK